MAEITTTQSFSDGDTVTATKLNNIQANASIQPDAILNRTAETSLDQANDLALVYDSSASSLKKVTISNLIKAGTASDFPVTGNATVGGTLGVTGTSALTGNTTIGGTLGVTGASTLSGNASIGGTLGVTGASTLSGNTAVLGALGVSDTVSLTKSTGTGLAVTSNATIGGTLGVTGNASLAGTLGVTGASTLTGNTSVGGTLGVSGAITASTAVINVGSGQIYKDASGNVGIGQSSPPSNGHLTINRAGIETNIQLQEGGVNTAQISSYQSDMYLTVAGSKDIILRPSGSEAMRIKASGNVGIGTASPAGKLHVSGGNLLIRNTDYLFFCQASSPAGGAAFLRAESDDTFAMHTSGYGKPIKIDGSTVILNSLSSGNVGVGTTSPVSKLDVSATTQQTNANYTKANSHLCLTGLSGNAAGGPFIKFGQTGDEQGFYIQGENQGGTKSLKFGEQSAELMRITSAGNVGIGTASPATKLHVASGHITLDDNQYILWGGTTNGINGNNSSNRLIFYTNSLERLRIDSSGRVGIGTSSPARLLTVDNETNPEIGLYTGGTERVKLSTGGSAISQLVVDLGGAERLRIASAGQIGIGGANYGTSGQVLTSGGASAAPSWTTISTTPADGSITPTKLSQPLTTATAVNSTSGTAIDFTGIPSWAKRILVIFSGVSTNGGAYVQVRIGTTSGIVSSGYSGSSGGTTFTSGFNVGDALGAGFVRHGLIELANVTSNTWVASGVIQRSNAASGNPTAGSLALSGQLTQIRITASNTSDAFNGGTINIMYMG
jgi:hypothetical protein